MVDSAWKWPSLAEWLLGVAGLALLVIGAVKFLEAPSDTGVITRVIAGALLLVSPFIIRRVERLSLSPTGFEFRLTRQISELGAPNTARILQNTDLAGFAQSYDFVHRELGDDEYHDARVHLQDHLVARSAALSSHRKFRASEVRELFQTGSPTLRVLALGLMKGRPSLTDGTTIMAPIEHPLSKNEQYHALLLAKLSWSTLSPLEKSEICIATQREIKSSDISGDRLAPAQEVLHLPTS